MDRENGVVIDEQFLQAAAEAAKVLTKAVEEAMSAIVETWHELYEAFERYASQLTGST